MTAASVPQAETLFQFAKSLPPWAILFAGVAAGWLRSFWQTIYNHTLGWAMRKLHVLLTCEESEYPEAYQWLTIWAEHRLRAQRITSLLLRARKDRDREEGILADSAAAACSSSSLAYELAPHYGTYYLRWKSRYLLVITHYKESSSSDGKSSLLSSLKPMRGITISIWGTLDRAKLLEILEEARAFYLSLHPHHLDYFTNSIWGDSWTNHQLQRRALDTIYLPSALVEDILRDITRFFNSRAIYRDLGIPWRRGYLLFGPPGTGKSSLVAALSSTLNLPIYYIHLTSINSAKELTSLLQSIKSTAIVLIEDIDCVSAARVRRREEVEDQPQDQPLPASQVAATASDDSGHHLRPSDLLNALDGLVATEQRIVILTTNFPERLDPALVRAGRIDRKFHIDYARDQELSRFHARASQHFALPGWEEFRAQLPERATIADAQARLLSSQPRAEAENESESESAAAATSSAASAAYSRTGILSTTSPIIF